MISQAPLKAKELNSLFVCWNKQLLQDLDSILNLFLCCTLRIRMFFFFYITRPFIQGLAKVVKYCCITLETDRNKGELLLTCTLLREIHSQRLSVIKHSRKSDYSS